MNEISRQPGLVAPEAEVGRTAPEAPPVAAERAERRPYGPLSVRCRGTNRAGEPCGRAPIRGGDVCILHGGAAPQVQRSAKMRLMAGADLAIDYLLNLLEPKPPCEHCGRSDADRDPVVVRACQIVLDRSGHHPTLTVEQVAPPDPYADYTEDQLIDRLEVLLAETKAQRDAHRNAGAIEGVVDAGFEVPEAEGTWSIPVGEPREAEGELTKEPANPLQGKDDE